MFDWTEIIKWLIGSGILAWLIRSIVKLWLDKDLEKFKRELEKTAIEHQIVFGKLHATRAEIISELYKKMSQMERANNNAFLSGIRFTDNQSALEQEASNCYKAFLPYAQDTKIWFNEEIEKLIDELCNKVNTLWLDYAQTKTWGDQMSPEERIEISQEVRSIIEDKDGLRHSLSMEFRKLLGAN